MNSILFDLNFLSLYFNSNLNFYNLRNIIYFYQFILYKNIKVGYKNLNFKFLFKIFFLENFPLFLKTSLYNQFLKKTFFYKKANFVLVIFFIKTFLAQFKRILGVMLSFGLNNLNVFFLFLPNNNSAYFEHFYSIFYKNFFITFWRLKKLYFFKLRYLYRFNFWFILKKFFKKCKVKLLVLWSISQKPIFKKFLQYLNISTLSFDADIRNFTISYSLSVNKFSDFQKLILSQFMLSSYIQGRKLSKFKSQKGFFKKANKLGS